jgi:hypothetical protein
METPNPALAADMKSKGIDVELALSVLRDFNAGKFDGVRPVSAQSLPGVDGVSVIAIGRESRRTLAFRADSAFARKRLGQLGVPMPDSVEVHGGDSVFGREALESIGMRLIPSTAYGVLNGGSATSYADSKKNMSFGEDVFSAFRDGFETLAPLCRGRSKGLTPAYVNGDGSPGMSFLTLKMRSRLIAAESYRARFGTAGSVSENRPFMPLYQMTSIANDAEMQEAFEACAKDPDLSVLEVRAGMRGADWMTAVQPMIAAYSHSSEGKPRRIFDRAFGKPDSAIALPGGHGQCFRILKPVFERLLESGVRFAYLGNVDNIGYVPDPLAIALLALSGKPAAFEFSLRTPIDVKGGILVQTSEGRRTVADIGPAISFERVMDFEKSGTPILFNCATGLFDLDWLVPRLDEISSTLPTRFSDQDKDAGRYSQAEQVTWEVSGILPDFLALAVEKKERFIAAKLLAETLLTSGFGSGQLPEALELTSRELREGLGRLLRENCGLANRSGTWEPAEN